VKKKLSFLLTGFLVVSLLVGCTPKEVTKEVIKEVPGVYEVVWPLSKSTATLTPLAAPIADLNGKTICEIRHSFRSDETFPMIEQLLLKQFPTIKFVSNMEMPDLPATTAAEMTALTNMLKQKGCDALLSGNGG
jgi:hypothetical protein